MVSEIVYDFLVIYTDLQAINTALEKRWSKFHRNATLLKRHLTWQYELSPFLSIYSMAILGKRESVVKSKLAMRIRSSQLRQVKMPQDASSSNVRDTRGLSGGERSFSTLCFALALHEMTEAPFRAMDEFDVFMDAVSRKISLDTIVDFALAQGSQWIFITPHDIRSLLNVNGEKLHGSESDVEDVFDETGDFMASNLNSRKMDQEH
ncbi:structural maintenance of chromosomes protein 6B, partial [Tanacetum coccineum]